MRVRYAGGMAQFEVQTVDPQSGMESWTLVSAKCADDARSRVLETGMVIGAIRLKSIDDGTPQTPTVNAATARGAVCPRCGTTTLPRGKGMHTGEEQVTCMLLLVAGFIPGVIYYAVVDSKPFCPKCRHRV